MSSTHGAVNSLKDGPGSAREDQDRQLIEGIRRGDVRAFEKLYCAYSPQLYVFAHRFLRSEDASWEVIDDIFLRIWQSRTEWTPLGHLRPYLFRAVKNQIYSYLRLHKNYNNVITVDEPIDRDGQEHSPHQQLEVKELAVLLWKLAEEMPSRRRMVFYLHRRHGLTYGEIADVMQISLSTVENHMGLALKELRERLEVELSW